jgi:2-C-methyl-D-erythritol 4-phosphate cytidylyltransferase
VLLLSKTPKAAVTRLFGLIPAAGSGSRFGGDIPKQFLPLGGRTLLAHSIDALLAAETIEQVLVVVAPDDDRYRTFAVPERVSFAALGGATRAETVNNGLRQLGAEHGARDDDWVLVHDAARPCLARAELQQLIDSLRGDPVGGLLAVPVADTLKRADEAQRCAQTVPREQLWRAATPQMFRYGVLQRALAHPQIRANATDEAAAVEALGLRPRLIEGRVTNVKVTLQDDLPLAAAILRIQGRIE